MGRVATKDLTLADGMRIPRGTMVSAATYAMNHDDALFADAGTFDAFRFARMRGGEGQSVKHQFTSTSPEFLSFGHGHHAWCVPLSILAGWRFVSLLRTRPVEFWC